MHAHIEQIISLRDREPVEALTAAHVHTCEHCRNQLTLITERKAALMALPALQPSPHLFKKVHQRLDPTPLGQRRLSLVAAALLATVLVVAWVSVSLSLNGHPLQRVEAGLSRVQTPPDAVSITPAMPVVAQDASQSGRIQDLVRQSRSLEAVITQLDYLPANAAARSTDNAVGALRDRLAVLDYRLNRMATDPLAPDQVEQLWQRRVDALQNLVNVQYAGLAMQGYHGFQVIPVNSLDDQLRW